MIAMLAKMIPFRDYLYAAAGIALVVWYNVHVHNVEVRYAARQTAAIEDAVAIASQQALSAAKKIADAKDKQYAVQSAQVEATYAKQLQSADDQHARDLDRVRKLTAQVHSNTDAVLPGTGPAPPGSDFGPVSADALAAAARLADALRRDDAQLQQCWDERDTLTGK